MDKKEDLVSFPSTVGLTGFVFKNHSKSCWLILKTIAIYHSNHVQKDARFDNATDNVSAYPDPQTMMICPILDLNNDINSLSTKSKYAETK